MTATTTPPEMRELAQRMLEKANLLELGGADEHAAGLALRAAADQLATVTAERDKTAELMCEMEKADIYHDGLATDRLLALQKAEARVRALEEALRLLLDPIEIAVTSSYCEFCDSHAPKDIHGHLTGTVKHADDCALTRARAALSPSPGPTETT